MSMKSDYEIGYDVAAARFSEEIEQLKSERDEARTIVAKMADSIGTLNYCIQELEAKEKRAIMVEAALTIAIRGLYAAEDALAALPIIPDGIREEQESEGE